MGGRSDPRPALEKLAQRATSHMRDGPNGTVVQATPSQTPASSLAVWAGAGAGSSKAGQMTCGGRHAHDEHFGRANWL